MSNKEIVADLLQQLPEGASLHEIARRIEFVAEVRKNESEETARSRLALECAKLSPEEEMELAEVGLTEDAKEWAKY